MRTLTLAAIAAAACGAAAADPKPEGALKVHMISGSREYGSEPSLKALKAELEKTRGMKCTLSPAQDGGKDVPGLEGLDAADVLIVFCRRNKVAGADLEKIKQWFKDGRPAIGIRTSSHAFQGYLAMDKEVFGGSYKGHGGGEEVRVKIDEKNKDHPILKGVKEWTRPGKLYRNQDNAPDVILLLTGQGRKSKDTQPVAWARVYDKKKDARAFYTSMGYPHDFEDENFKAMLLNAIYWVAKREPPPGKPSATKPAPEAAAPYVVPASVLGGSGRPAPSDRLTLGLIGLGSMGMRHLEGFCQHDGCRITAVCDVDAGRCRAGAAAVNRHYRDTGCAACADFRQLLGRRDLDTVCIAVPDHWHAVISIAACRAGKDVYGEKPLALTVAEGRAIVRAVSRYGRVWETGSWQRSTRQFRFACELVRNGRIGTLKRVEVGIGLGFRINPQPAMPVPPGFDYDMWLGPAPPAPYTEKRCHWTFRWILDYSGGQPTDWGAHHVDIAHWGMDADEAGPVTVEGRGEFPTDGLFNAPVRYSFDCQYPNGLTMRVAGNDVLPQGVRWIGEKGCVHVTRSGLKTQPANLVKARLGPDELHLPRPAGDNRQGHRHDFLHCVRTRGRTMSPVEVDHNSAVVCHLGNIAMLLGRKLRWDAAAERFIDDDEANRMLSRPMRPPWTL